MHTYPVNGYAVSAYNILLTVTNTSGLSATASTVATISAPQPLADGALTGVVSSGTIPVAYAHVYLFAANTTAYGQPSVSLLNATLTGTSDSLGAYVATAFNGTFSLTGDYSCSSVQQLYLYVQGGDAGTGQNATEGLMAAIGSCPSSTGPGTSVTVNEVSTVAAAYALAGFATDATHVSSSGRRWRRWGCECICQCGEPGESFDGHGAGCDSVGQRDCSAGGDRYAGECSGPLH